MLEGKSLTVPNQAADITEVVYRFQGGIMPVVKAVTFDPEGAPEGYIDARNIAGFDITDAFNALQAGKEKYQAYMADKKEKAKQAALDQKAELEQLRLLRQQQQQQTPKED